MKIGILGNMNNNGFSLLRYLRDLGMDAHLLLFRDDGTGHSSHFAIRCDTWCYSKWQAYISQLPATNGYGQALSRTFIDRIILGIVYLIRRGLMVPNALMVLPPKRADTKVLRSILSRYDVFIGSGATPAILDSLCMRLDIFFPYSIGIEYVNQPNFSRHRKSKNPIVRYIARQMYLKQVSGIRNARTCVNMECSERTIESFKEIGVKPEVSAVPFVYPFEEAIEEEFSKELSIVLA